ncbi:hypothetical protein AZA_84545 [Nitrospirillum viridazoti Y2]|nr:hypothetical protein AZA_84545 [Nitrospirillum amazonense Y2]
MGHRVLQPRCLAHGAGGHGPGLVGQTQQPQRAGQRDARAIAMIEAEIDCPPPVGGHALPDGEFQFLPRTGLVAGKMMGNTGQGGRDGRRLRRVDHPGHLHRHVGPTMGRRVVADPLMEDLQAAQKAQLVPMVAQGGGDGQRAAQRCFRRLAIAAGEHQRQAQRRLDLNLHRRIAVAVQVGHGPRAPVAAFHQQRHVGENRHARRRQADGQRHVAIGAEAPVQGAAYVAQLAREVMEAIEAAPIGKGRLLQLGHEKGRVPPGHGVEGLRSPAQQLFPGVGACHFQQAVGAGVAQPVGGDQRLGRQLIQGQDRRIGGHLLIRHHLQRRVDGERAQEDRQPFQGQALRLRQKVVTPIQGGLQGLLARQGGAAPGPGQAEPLPQQLGRGLQPVGRHPHRRQFDGQGHAVQPAAHVGHHPDGIDIEAQRAVARRRALHEQRHRRKGQQRVQRQALGRSVGIGQRAQPMHMLRPHAQGFAAGGNDVDMGRGVHETFHHPRHGVHQVLAIVQDQQQMFLPDMTQDDGHGVFGLDQCPQRAGDGRGQQGRILQGGQVDKAHLAGEVGHQHVPHLHRQGGLAHAGGAHDGEKRRFGYAARQQMQVRVATEDARQTGRQAAGGLHGVGPAVTRQRSRERRRLRHRRRALQGGDEGVAHPHLGRDVAGAVLAIAQELAQASHVEAQAAILHHHVRPDPLQQVTLGQHAAGLFHQGDQQVEGAAADLDRGAVAGQQALAHGEAEGTKGDGALQGRDLDRGNLGRGRHVVHKLPPFRSAVESQAIARATVGRPRPEARGHRGQVCGAFIPSPQVRAR